MLIHRWSYKNLKLQVSCIYVQTYWKVQRYAEKCRCSGKLGEVILWENYCSTIVEAFNEFFWRILMSSEMPVLLCNAKPVLSMHRVFFWMILPGVLLIHRNQTKSPLFSCPLIWSSAPFVYFCQPSWVFFLAEDTTLQQMCLCFGYVVPLLTKPEHPAAARKTSP